MISFKAVYEHLRDVDDEFNDYLLEYARENADDSDKEYVEGEDAKPIPEDDLDLEWAVGYISGLDLEGDLAYEYLCSLIPEEKEIADPDNVSA